MEMTIPRGSGSPRNPVTTQLKVSFTLTLNPAAFLRQPSREPSRTPAPAAKDSSGGLRVCGLGPTAAGRPLAWEH